jgi:REP element-mobilizing transposase RayT
MPQSLVKNLVHLVFSTKHRQAWLPDDVREPLFAYQAGIFRQWESPALVIGGVEDHVHALFSLSKIHALKKIVEEVKKGSSKWMKTDDTKKRGLPLAERVRRLFRERVECSHRSTIYRESAEAPSYDDVSG